MCWAVCEVQCVVLCVRFSVLGCVCSVCWVVCEAQCVGLCVRFSKGSQCVGLCV